MRIASIVCGNSCTCSGIHDKLRSKSCLLSIGVNMKEYMDIICFGVIVGKTTSCHVLISGLNVDIHSPQQK